MQAIPHPINTAVILVGGKGTRLKSAVPDLPKPLAEINGEPFLFLLLRKIKAANINRVILLTGYGHDKIKSACGNGDLFDLEIVYSQELSPLGTAGALKNACHLLPAQSFLLLNGDTYLDTPLAQLTQSPIDANLMGFIGVTALDDTMRYGTVQFDDDYRIHAFREKHSSSRGYVNAGVYLLSPKIFEFIPDHQFVSLEQETLPQLLTNPVSLKALPLSGQFYDIGLPSSYADFNTRYVLRHHNLPDSIQRILLTLLHDGHFWFVSKDQALESFLEQLRHHLNLPDLASWLRILPMTFPTAVTLFQDHDLVFTKSNHQLHKNEIELATVIDDLIHLPPHHLADCWNKLIKTKPFIATPEQMEL